MSFSFLNFYTPLCLPCMVNTSLNIKMKHLSFMWHKGDSSRSRFSWGSLLGCKLQAVHKLINLGKESHFLFSLSKGVLPSPYLACDHLRKYLHLGSL